jgi:hypothetical protein
MSKARPLKNTDKDFGRRLYASDKGYTEQMKEVTDKAMLDVAPFHLSELKKPYLSDSYEEMEHQYSPIAGIAPVPPQMEYNKTTGVEMCWKTEPPDEGEPKHWYLVEVWNMVKEQMTTLNGKVTKYQRTYYPAWFEMKNTKTDTKGFKLEISLPYAVLDAHGEIRGFQSGGNVWYDIKDDEATIKAILARLKKTGSIRAETTARLTLDADADGEVEITAKDGKTELKKKVSVQLLLSGHYIKCHHATTEKAYYGHLDGGVIDNLCGYSSRMKKYNEVSLSHPTPVYSGTPSSSTETINTDTGWYFTGGLHNVVVDGVTIPVSHHARITGIGSYVTDTLSYSFSVNGSIVLSGSQSKVNGSVTETTYGKWINVITLETVYEDVPVIVVSTRSDGPIITPTVAACWTYADLYYLALASPISTVAYSGMLSVWYDKPMIVSQLSLRDDSKELLFINPNTHDLGFRNMPGGSSIAVANVVSVQTVNGVPIHVDGYDHANVYYYERTP